MGTELVLNVEDLFAPITEAAPCGSDPRLDPSPVSPYQTLKDARHAAADAERNIERGFSEASDAKNADEALKKSWELIARQAPTLLADVGKDIEVGAWLIEALLRTHQLGGLRDGLTLMNGLIQRYWDDLFPLPDEDGLETRLVPLASLSGTEAEGRLIAPLKRVPLTEGDDPPPFSFWQYENAASGAADGGTTIAAFTTSLQRSSQEFVRDLAEDAQACLAALAQLDSALQARCGAEAPSFSRVRGVLSGLLEAVRAHAALSLTEAEPRAPVEPETAAASSAEPARGGLVDRQAAFRQLEELAAFFRRTEPHSPMAYAIDNLVRRGRMTFSELAEELIDDGNARRSYFVNAGVQPPPEDSKGS